MGNGYSEERVIYEDNQVRSLEEVVEGREFEEVMIDYKGKKSDVRRIRIMKKLDNGNYWVRVINKPIIFEYELCPVAVGLIKTRWGWWVQSYLVRL